VVILTTTELQYNLLRKNMTTNNQFESVRQWGAIRGIDGATFQRQYQRVLQEVVEIHDAMNNEDMAEVSDAIGDTIVTLINLAKTVGMNAEDCLQGAFETIELRKGLNKNGDFVRYAKLPEADKSICDEKQGNPGNQYFISEMLETLKPENFKA
jgi:NTP pyrophosphatase (non-canonical NTP hydrolase)